MYIKTTWQDRIVEKPRTYTITDNGDGTHTLTPSPGTVVQEGTPVNEASMNNLETQYEKAVKLCGIFGDGADDAFDSAGDVTLTVPVADESIIVKKYTSFRLNAGHTFTVDKRCRGLIICVQGNAVIDGTIHMDGKAANVAVASSIQTKIRTLTFQGEYMVPAGGSGGNGGAGEGVTGLAGGTGGTGSAGSWFGGGHGGGGGGGVAKWLYDNRGGAGGAGGNGTLGAALSSGGNSVITTSSSPGNGGGNAGGGSGAAAGTGTYSATSGKGGAGAGGGGGGGAATGTSSPPCVASPGGDGGAGGGLLIFLVGGDITIGATGIARANGSNGGNGGAGVALSGGYSALAGDGGGGGGCGGGGVFLGYVGTYTNSGTVQANGGSGGTAPAGATAGQPGSVGTVVAMKVVA